MWSPEVGDEIAEIFFELGGGDVWGAIARAAPAILERQRIRHRENDREFRARRKLDPQRYAEEKIKRHARGLREWQEVKTDPEKHARVLAYRRELNRKIAARKKEEREKDPAKREAYRAKVREAARKAREKAKAEALADPAKAAELKAKTAEQKKRQREKLLADPERLAAYRARQAEWARKKKQQR